MCAPSCSPPAATCFAPAPTSRKSSARQRPGRSPARQPACPRSVLCILDSGKPVVAAVNGAALGAGFVLAACCDLIFAADTAVFGMPEIDVGMGGGASFLQRILPPSKVRRMMLTGERVPAAELYRLGAVESCVPGAQLLPAALEVASAIAAKSPAAVRTIRESFLTVEGLGLREGFRVEQNYITPLSKTPEAQEARRAFLEKRKPVF